MCVPRTTDLAPGFEDCPVEDVLRSPKEERAGKSREGRGFPGYGDSMGRGCDSESEKACVGGRLRSKTEIDCLGV